MHTNAAEPRRTIHCRVVECVDGGREAVGKCRNVQENVKQRLVFIRSGGGGVGGERESALHVFSGPTTVWRDLVMPARPTASQLGGLTHSRVANGGCCAKQDREPPGLWDGSCSHLLE